MHPDRAAVRRRKIQQNSATAPAGRWFRSRPVSPVRHAAEFALQPLEHRILLSTVAWSNPAGGDFNVGGNWTGGQVPGQNDDAVIAIATTNPINYSSGSVT